MKMTSINHSSSIDFPSKLVQIVIINARHIEGSYKMLSSKGIVDTVMAVKEKHTLCKMNKEFSFQYSGASKTMWGHALVFLSLFI